MTANLISSRGRAQQLGSTFASLPPNAALVIDDAPDGRDTFVVELTSARYDENADRVTYRAALLDEGPQGRLADVAADADDSRGRQWLTAVSRHWNLDRADPR